MEHFSEWLFAGELGSLERLVETSDRYSVEVNYRTSLREVLDGYAKLVLGYIMAGMKNNGYHVKHVYSERPYRIMIAASNWEDGMWVSAVLFNNQINKFVLANGYWNKDRRTMSVQDQKVLEGENAAEMVRKLCSHMCDLRKKDPRKINHLNPAPLKRGPKK